MKRDEEISRLIKYAQGLGVKVTFSDNKTAKAHAEWALDGSEIIIYKKEHTSKTEVILSLIHELGHQLFFVHEKNREPDYKFEEAIDVQNHYEKEYKDKIVPVKYRKKILDIERGGTLYWENIYKETNLKFPIWKLYAQMEFDIFQYEKYYETGYFPTMAEKKAKRKEVNTKYKGVKYD